MKIKRSLLAGLVGVSVFSVISCAYDPYYSGGAYSGSYGHGYGYGSSGFSTSIFVSTGNPRWGYDPYAGCYYDYTRRAYYDPYLYGYYPAGYRPRYVYGAPHPGGWTHGRSYCPPPSRISSHTLTNYGNRAENYRSLGRDWSRNVSISAPTIQPRPSYSGSSSQDRGFYHSRGSGFDQRPDSFPSRGGSFQRGGDDRNRGSSGREDSGRGGFRRESPRETGFQPSLPMNRGEDRHNQPAGALPEIQPRQRIDRSPAPSPPSMERPTAPTLREFSPGSGERGGRTRGESPDSGGDAPGRGRGGIRPLGEG